MPNHTGVDLYSNQQNSTSCVDAGESIERETESPGISLLNNHLGGKKVDDKHLKLYSGFRLFVAGATPDNLVELLSGTPLGMRLASSEEDPIFTLTHQGVEFKTMLPPAKRSSLSLKRAVRTLSGKCVDGMILNLPPFYARLHAAQKACGEGMPYRLDKLSGALAKDLAEEIGKSILGFGKSCKLPGMQAQAGTAPGARKGTVSMNTRTAARMWDDLHKIDRRLEVRLKSMLVEGQTLDELTEEEQLQLKAAAMHGSVWFCHRYPVNGKFNCRQITLNITNEVVSSQFVVNAGDWEFLNAGDEDGDILYLFTDEQLGYEDVAPSRLWTPAVILDSSEFITQLVEQYKKKPSDPEEIRLKSVEQVINACIRELTGLLDYTVHNIAYANGLCGETGSRKAWSNQIGGVFEPYTPMAECVFDAKKSETGNAELIDFASTLRGAMSGKVFDSKAFNPYIADARLQGLMDSAIQTIGGEIGHNSKTLFGRVLRAGQNGAKKSVDILKDLVSAGESVDNVLYLMHKDAGRGQTFLLPEEEKAPVPKEPPTEKQLSYLKRLGYKGEAPESKKAASDLIAEMLKGPKIRIDTDPEGHKGFTGVFTQLWVGDRQIVARKPDGRPWVNYDSNTGKLTARIYPLWKQNHTRKDGSLRKVDLEINVVLPKDYDPKKLVHGHVVVKMGTNRVFRPVMTTDTEGNVVKLKFTDELRTTVFRSIQTLEARTNGGSIDSMPADISAEVQKWLIKLPEIDTYTKNFAALEEFEVRTRETRLPERWDELRTILTEISSWADVNMTSKGKPGSCVGVATIHGITGWYNTVNPFAQYTERKRLPQHRVCAESVPLAYPTQRTVGSNPLFDERELTVAIFDSTANCITADGWDEVVKHDTGQVYPSGYKKLAVREYLCPAGTLEQAEMIRDRFVRNGLVCRIIESTKAYDNELTEAAFEVLVSGPFLDAGKVMASLGPYKFVQCVDPNQIFAKVNDKMVTIDVVLPRYTTVKKNALDAVLYMLCVRAGIKDPTTLPADLDEKIAYLMERIPDGGMVPIYYGDGNCIGKAFVSKLPFYRTHHFAVGIESAKTGDRGVTVHWNEWAINGVRPHVSKKIVRELRDHWDVMNYLKVNPVSVDETDEDDTVDVTPEWYGSSEPDSEAWWDYDDQ